MDLNPDAKPELSKSIINNQVVSMRGFVKQARTHTINKLTRTARKLRTKRGTDDEVVKNQRKANRLLEEIVEIKALKLDVISKFALTNTKLFLEVAKKGMAQDRALHRLSSHSAIVKTVNEFREKYPNWQTEIPAILQIMEVEKVLLNKKGNQKKKKKTDGIKKLMETKEKTKETEKVLLNKKGNQKKKKKTNGIKKLMETKEKTKETEDGKADVKKGTMPTSTAKVEKKSPLKKLESVKKLPLKKPGSVKDHDKDEKPKLVDEVVEPKKTEKGAFSLNEFVKQQRTADLDKLVKIEGETQVKRIKLQDLPTACDEIPVDVTEPRKETIPQVKRPTIKSSFFLTDDGDDGDFSDGSNDRSDGERVTYEFERRPDQFRPNNRGERFSPARGRGRQFVRNDQRFTGSSRGNDRHRFQDSRGQGNRRERRTNRQFSSVNDIPLGPRKESVPVPSLHPSWEARRRQKESQLVAFQGKITKFDDS